MHHRDFVDRVWVKIRMEKGVRRIHTATRLPVSKQQTSELIKSIFETLSETLESGQIVLIPGFGKFSLKQYPKGSLVTHPKTREKVPRRPDRMRTVRFKPSSVLLNTVNNESIVAK